MSGRYLLSNTNSCGMADGRVRVVPAARKMKGRRRVVPRRPDFGAERMRSSSPPSMPLPSRRHAGSGCASASEPVGLCPATSATPLPPPAGAHHHQRRRRTEGDAYGCALPPPATVVCAFLMLVWGR